MNPYVISHSPKDFLEPMYNTLFYGSVCSVEATLGTNEINYFCERQSPLDIGHKSLTAFVRFCWILLMWEYIISSFDFFET